MFSQQQAIELWESNDLIRLGLEADAVRKLRHPSGIVTYTLSSDNKVVEHVFRSGDSLKDRLETLAGLFEDQEQTGDIITFRPLVDRAATGIEYLKTIAFSRLCLDNVPHIQASCGLFGLKVAQLSLRFGVDDLGNAEADVSEEEVRRTIRDAGFVPKQRDALFRTYSIA